MRLTLILLTLTTTLPAQWTIQQSHTTASLRGIHALGKGIAWASGTAGTVLRTTDDGTTWQTCTTPPEAEHLDLRGIQAFDANTAIVMSSGKGDLSRIYKTTDACKSWKLLFTNPDKEGFWDAVVFEDRSSGVILGDPVHGSFYLSEISDGGSHWVQQRNNGLKADGKLQGAFAASNSSLLLRDWSVHFGSGGTDGAYVYSETEITVCLDDCPESDLNLDGHKNRWTRLSVSIGHQTESSGIFSIAYRHLSPQTRGTDLIVAVGGDYLKPEDPTATAAYTLDGGKTWQPAQTPPHGYRSSVAYSPTTKTWITVGPNGTDISTDDGKNWQPLKPSPTDQPDADQNWNALSLPFAVGPKGRIGKLNPAPKP
jgi:photosystem II stability/assembly factor-like uncharacterized protein